jgi:hypothetical protein
VGPQQALSSVAKAVFRERIHRSGKPLRHSKSKFNAEVRTNKHVARYEPYAQQRLLGK